MSIEKQEHYKTLHSLCLEIQLFTEMVVRTEFMIKDLNNPKVVNPSMRQVVESEFLKPQKEKLIKLGIERKNIENLNIEDFHKTIKESVDLTFTNMKKLAGMED